MGGAAVVFRHAKGLVARGHAVTVIAPQRGPGVVSVARHLAVQVRDRVHGVRGATPYASDGVDILEPATVSGIDWNRYEAVIATGHQTAPWVAKHAANGHYFLQGDERALSARAGETWSLPLRRFAVSHWLADLVRANGHKVEGVVPNAVDPAAFALDAPLANRALRVIALYHRHPVKGPETLIRALGLLREALPNLNASLVAARPPSHRLPDWVEVVIRPTPAPLRELLNGSAVCLHTSVVEGWGLFPMEAAACGCAVVSTASLGPREYLKVGSSMIEVPVGDADALASEAIGVLRDPARRIDMAGAGLRDVSRFSWEESTAALDRLLTGTASRS